MDPYSKGFRDGAAAASEAVGDRLDDAIEVVRERPHGLYTTGKVVELMQLIARENRKLAAQIMAVGENPREGDESDGDQGEEAG